MKEKIINFIASGFYISYIPDHFSKKKGKFRGCGLFGTILAFALYPLLPERRIYLLITLILFTALSIYISDKAYRTENSKDNPLIVIDEICGYWTGFLFLDRRFVTAIILFIFFRFFDTVKPYPIKKLENISNRGIAIVMDDIAAAFYAALLTCITVKTIF
jgi:phosphatidylglycerophosphatase A